MTTREPRADRPDIPYGLLKPDEGAGLIPWSEVRARLRDARVYWIATTRPDGRPHAMPVWGVWLDETFYFSTGDDSRNGRNLARNPALAVHLEDGEEAVILEGVARLVSEPEELARINAVYGPKYEWGEMEPFYALRPRVAFAWYSRGVGPDCERDFTGSATRYRW